MYCRLIKVQLEFAAADGRFEAGGSEVPLGLEAEAVVPQPATGRRKREGAQTSRHPPVGQRGPVF